MSDGNRSVEVQREVTRESGPPSAPPITSTPVAPAIAPPAIDPAGTIIKLSRDGKSVEIHKIAWNDADMLTALRSALTKIGAMDKQDRFVLDNAVVQRSAEDLLSAKATIQGDTIVVRRDIPVAMVDASLHTVKAVARGAYDVIEDRTGRALGRDGKAVASAVGDMYAILEPGQKARLIEQAGVFRGVLMRQDEIVWSFRDLFVTGDAPHLHITTRVPRNTYGNRDIFTSSKRDTERESTHGESANLSFSSFYVGGSVEASKSEAMARKDKEDVVYSQCEITIAKLEIRLHDALLAGDLLLHPDCRSDLASFETRIGRDFADFVALRDFFERWGAYVATEQLLGGKLYSTDSKRIKSDQDLYKFQSEVKAQFKASMTGMGATGGVGQARSQDERTVNDRQDRTALLQAIGGDPGLVTDPPQWAASLGSYLAWRPVRLNNLKPIYDFASSRAQQGIYATLWAWQSLWRKDPMMLDLDEYLLPLARRHALFHLPTGSMTASTEKSAAPSLVAGESSPMAAPVMAGEAGDPAASPPGYRLPTRQVSQPIAGVPRSTVVLDRPSPKPISEPATAETAKDVTRLRGRIPTHRPTAQSLQHRDLIVAERGNALMLLTTQEGNTLLQLAGFPKAGPSPATVLRSSPVMFSDAKGEDLVVCVVQGPKRALSVYDAHLIENKPDGRTIGYDTALRKADIDDVIGSPVFIPYSGGSDQISAVQTSSVLAVRTGHHVHVRDVRDAKRPEALVPIAISEEVFGNIAGFIDPGRTMNLFVPTSPVRNYYFTGDKWDFRALPTCWPSGDLAVIYSDGNFHVLVPTGKKLRYFRGVTEFDQIDVETVMGSPSLALAGNRIVVLGRIGQQLQSFSIDLNEKDISKAVGKPSAPFGMAVTSDPHQFRGYTLDGDRHNAALVYVGRTDIMYLWYDHGNDAWSLLPP